MAGLLQGKSVLVMGVANRWSIAYAIAKAAVREGAQLFLSYQGERQRQTVEELAEGLGNAATLLCDVGSDESVKALFEGLQQRGVKLHALVHSIAFANREDLENPFENTSRAGFSLAMDVSAYSLVTVSHHAAPLMSEGGAIVTLTYLGATRVVPNYNVMGVAKAALEASTRYLASDLGPKGIRVNAISAGPIKTASARAIKDFSSILDKIPERAPLRRLTETAEVADTAVFLLSDLGRGVTGNVIFVDSGYQVLGM